MSVASGRSYDGPVDHARLPIGPIRQRGSLFIGITGVVLALVLLYNVVSTGANARGIGVLLLLAGWSYGLFVHPSLTLRADGVHIANPLRRVVIPWHLVATIRTVWNLELSTSDGKHTVWAISASRHRPAAARKARISRDDSDAAAMGDLVRQIQQDLLGPDFEAAEGGTPAGSPVGGAPAGSSVGGTPVAGSPLVEPASAGPSGDVVTRSWDVVGCLAIGLPVLVLAAALVA